MTSRLWGMTGHTQLLVDQSPGEAAALEHENDARACLPPDENRQDGSCIVPLLGFIRSVIGRKGYYLARAV